MSGREPIQLPPHLGRVDRSGNDVGGAGAAADVAAAQARGGLSLLHAVKADGAVKGRKVDPLLVVVVMQQRRRGAAAAAVGRLLHLLLPQRHVGRRGHQLLHRIGSLAALQLEKATQRLVNPVRKRQQLDQDAWLLEVRLHCECEERSAHLGLLFFLPSASSCRLTWS
jgi:hypothetical protein